LATITATTVDGGFNDTCDVTVRARPAGEIAVTGITLNRYAMTLDAPGLGTATGTLEATISPSNAETKTIKWYSSDTSVATVGSSDGLTMTVTAVAAGSTVVIATTNDGGKVALCNVTVLGTPVPPQEGVIPVAVITLNTPTATLNSIGEERELAATLTPSNTTQKNITWTSSSPAVTVVKKDELTATITARSFGTAVIMAVTDNGKIAICTVDVEALPDDAVRVTGLTLDKSNEILVIGDNDTVELTAAIEPSGATNKNVTWTSSNESVATVESTGLGTALVTAVSAGWAGITATSADGGFYKFCNITVSTEAPIPVTGVTLSPTSLNFSFEELGSEKSLTATIAPHNATDQNISWSVTVITDPSGAGVVSLTPSADTKTVTVKALGLGTATITAAGANGRNDTCVVNVMGETVAVEDIEMDKELIELTMPSDGTVATAQLNVTVLPENATNKRYTFSVSDNGYVSVSPEGLVVALRPGTVYVIATTDEGGFKAQCTVVITAAQVVPVTGVMLNTNLLTLRIGGAAILQAYVQPPNASDKGVEWASNNSLVATVDKESGLVTAKAAGTALITVTATGGPSQTIQTTCTVTVQADSVVAIPVDGITLNKPNLTLQYNEDTGTGTSETLIATISPSNATDITTQWFSTNGAVATVLNGTVTAKGYGTAFIIATTVSAGKMDFCFVNVPEPSQEAVPVTGITLDTSAEDIVTDESIFLTATVTPSGASNPVVRWTTSNPAVAIVIGDGSATAESKGTVTGITPGTVNIVAITLDGGLAAFCSVTVRPARIPVTGVTLNLTEFEMKEGEEAALSATVAPPDATDKNVTWDSTNKSVATVDQTGLVKAIAFGTTTITVVTADGTKTATCAISVDYVKNSSDSRITFAQIADEDWGLDDIKLSLTGTGANAAVPTTHTITIKDKAQYTSITCYVNKGTVAGTVNGDDIVFVLDAATMDTGSYYLTLEVARGGDWKNKTVTLMIVE
jgi:uncharacterized protein YjdB